MEKEEEQIRNFWVGSPKAWHLIQDVCFRRGPCCLECGGKERDNTQEPEGPLYLKPTRSWLNAMWFDLSKSHSEEPAWGLSQFFPQWFREMNVCPTADRQKTWSIPGQLMPQRDPSPAEVLPTPPLSRLEAQKWDTPFPTHVHRLPRKEQRIRIWVWQTYCHTLQCTSLYLVVYHSE